LRGDVATTLETLQEGAETGASGPTGTPASTRRAARSASVSCASPGVPIATGPRGAENTPRCCTV
jgi:hypothetical protein